MYQKSLQFGSLMSKHTVGHFLIPQALNWLI